MKCPICKKEFEFEPSCGHTIGDYIEIIERTIEKITTFRNKKTNKNYFHHDVLTQICNDWLKILEGKQYANLEDIK